MNDRERHQRLAELFERAIDVDPGARSAWLDRECEGNDELRARLIQLLLAFGTPCP